VIHGKPKHEETRATFSHASFHAPAIVINDMAEAIILGDFITGKMSLSDFEQFFSGRFSNGFDPMIHLKKIGVVNQTTMLASDTQAIADYLKSIMIEVYKPEPEAVSDFFADTRDTLCYATNDNQSAVYGLLEHSADLAIVVGGYNSSNTSHLVELCEEKLPTYYIDHPDRIIDQKLISHFDFHKSQNKETVDFLPTKEKTRILMTSGASCPDAMVESIILKLASFFGIEDWEKSVRFSPEIH
jgi:4-hydroxy-3-methylbut-2-enyl diphosphate reductase